MIRLACLQCGGAYIVRDWATGHAHFCPNCREARKRNYERRRYAEIKDGLLDIIPTLEEYVGASLDDHIEDFVDGEDTRPAIQEDRQPVGWLSPTGSNDGRSSYFREVRQICDVLAIRAARDPWWAANPHWCAPLHVELPEKPPAVACSDAKGSRAGYARHLRAGESACDDCLEAQAAYFREYRERRNPA